VAERPAINASPLILLSKSGLLDLLHLAGTEIVVPDAVAAEIRQRGANDPTVQALATTEWLTVIQTPPVPSLIQSWDLGSGESAVLTWVYMYPGTEAIVDDLAARRCAAALGIPVRGTLGLVLTAKQRGAIPAARPVVERLRGSGMYLSDQVMNQALALIGE
jgi:predicted nucleic acid-binding protein